MNKFDYVKPLISKEKGGNNQGKIHVKKQNFIGLYLLNESMHGFTRMMGQPGWSRSLS